MENNEEAYNRQYQELVSWFHQEEAALEKVTNQLEDKNTRLLLLNFFIGQLGEMGETIEVLDSIFWNLHLDCVEVDEEG